MRNWLKMPRKSALMGCERGATAVEYGLILAMVVLAMLTALSNVATKTTGMWNDVTEKVINS